MKIVLVEPPNIQRSGKWEEQKVFRTPTNLAILASYLRRSGYSEIKIFDFDVNPDTTENISKAIMSEKPDVIGFTCLTPRYPTILEIAGKCKKVSQKVSIVLGGAHVTGTPESIFNNSSIDYGVIGEGEEAFVELLDGLKSGKDVSGIDNIVLCRKGKIKVNVMRPFIKDLDLLPFPAWDLLDLSKYTDPGLFNGPHVGIITGRGCPYNCVFCASKVTWKNKVRLRSAENVVGELEELVKKFKITEFMFYDDTFTVNKDRAVKICSMIIEKKLNIRFYVQSRADTIDIKLAEILKAAGCFGVAVGVESGDEGMLRRVVKKGVTKEEIRQSVKILKKVGLPCVTSYVIGLPGDTHETIKATIDFASELNTEQAKFMIATPYPGTELYRMACERGLLKEDWRDYTYYQHVAVNLSCVSDQDLMKYQQEAYNNYDRKKRSLK